LKVPEKVQGIILVIPAFILLMIISIYPLFYTIFISLQEWNYLKVYIPPKFIGAENYIKLFQDPIFLNTLYVTTLFTVMCILIELILGIGLGCLLYSERLKWKRVIRSLILLPMMLTPVIIGFTWKSLLNLKWGIINYFLHLIGIKGIMWHTSLTQALPTMVLIDVWEWTPFVTLIIMALLSSLPTAPFEAAAIDGASKWQIFRHITLPMLKDGIIMIILLRALDALKEFDKIYILTRGGPEHATDVLSIFGYRIAFFHGYVSYAAAASIILFIIIMILCTILFKLIKR
jgi:multiple sugar transport system permease protein